MRNITHIIVHESDSSWGDSAVIDDWHKKRGWIGCGYHDIILNGKRNPKSSYNENEDGFIEGGRMLKTVGAHARGFNRQSIGICLIGRGGKFTEKQLSSLIDRIIKYMLIFGIPVENVLGHYEIPLSGGKVCPEIDMKDFRNKLSEKMESLENMKNYGA